MSYFSNADNYLLLLWEIVNQFPSNRYILSQNGTINTFNKLNANMFCVPLQKELIKAGSLSKLNTTHKQNINYITKKIDQDKYEINKLFFYILSKANIQYVNENWFFVFNSKIEYQVFEIFRRFKPINSLVFDSKTKNSIIKPLFLQYKQTHEVFRYDKKICVDGMDKATVIFGSKLKDDFIFSKREYVDVDDFFIFKKYELFNCAILIDCLKLLSEEIIINNLIKKLNQNVFYPYVRELSIKENNNDFKNINTRIENLVKKELIFFNSIFNLD